MKLFLLKLLSEFFPHFRRLLFLQSAIFLSPFLREIFHVLSITIPNYLLEKRSKTWAACQS
jgi:hypothetical protein